MQSVGIVGAGMAGLACARRLAAAGVLVRIFDKGRGVGGRVAQRRGDANASFDHGAQYFTARDVAFQELVQQWIDVGVVAPWQGRLGTLDGNSPGNWRPTRTETPRYVGVPVMTSLPKHLAAGLDITQQLMVEAVERVDNRWRILDDQRREVMECDTLVVTTPAPQAMRLLTRSTWGTEQERVVSQIVERLSTVKMAPCWAVMLAFAERLAVDWDGAFIESSALAWVARNSSKPGRSLGPDCWVLHASPEWSKQHAEYPADWVCEFLCAELWRVMGLTPCSASQVSAHRWRFAIPEMPLDERCLFNAELRLGLCGDWCGGPRVEGAYLSGLTLADQICS